MTILYLDASALVKLAVAEEGSAAIMDLATGSETLVTSVVAQVEVRRTLARIAPVYDADRIFEQCTFIDLNSAIIDRAGALTPLEVRSLDAIHVASALELRDEIDAFVTFDARQAAAASGAGLPVDIPG